MRHVTSVDLLAGILAVALLAAPAYAQQAIKSDIPDSLAGQAKVSEPTARATAMRRVIGGHIQAVELEHENGHLQYSYDLKVPGHSGITEVNVDALTGKVIAVHHESAKDEAKEGAVEK